MISINLPSLRTVGTRIFHPRTKLGRITLWTGALSILLLTLRWSTGSQPESKLHVWSSLVTTVFVICGLFLAFRWARPRLLWRLRNRLGVAYIFIGVIPIVLLLLMAGIAGYVFAGQFATYITTSDLQAKLQHLQASNNVLAARLDALQHSGRLTPQTAGEITADPAEDFQQRTATIWQGSKGFVLSTSGALLNLHLEKTPTAIPGDFSGFVLDQDSLHLRVVKHYDDGASKLTVISSVPITVELLQPITARLGAVTIVPPHRGGDIEIPPPADADPNLNLDPTEWQSVTAGSVPPPSNFSVHSIFS